MKTPENLEAFIKKFCEITKDCYNKVCGAGEWENLSEQQKHDCIMHFAKRFQKDLKNEIGA